MTDTPQPAPAPDPGAGPVTEFLRNLPGAESLGPGMTRVPHDQDDDDQAAADPVSPDALRHTWGH